LAGLAAVYVLQPPLPTALYGIGLAVMASTLADSIQPRIPFIAVKVVEGHRGLSHWILTSVGLAWLVNMAWGETMAIFFFAGYVSHLLLDMPSGGGIPLVGPLPFRIGTYWIKNGSRAEDVVRYLLIVACVVMGVMVAMQYIH